MWTAPNKTYHPPPPSPLIRHIGRWAFTFESWVLGKGPKCNNHLKTFLKVVTQVSKRERVCAMDGNAFCFWQTLLWWHPPALKGYNKDKNISFLIVFICLMKVFLCEQSHKALVLFQWIHNQRNFFIAQNLFCALSFTVELIMDICDVWFDKKNAETLLTVHI